MIKLIIFITITAETTDSTRGHNGKWQRPVGFTSAAIVCIDLIAYVIES